jgi:hypothetical protein
MVAESGSTHNRYNLISHEVTIMKQPISILLAGILALGLSACGPKTDTATTSTTGANATDTTATAPVGTPNGAGGTAGMNSEGGVPSSTLTTGGPGMASGTSGAATPMDSTTSTGAGMAGGTTASGSDSSATSMAPKHAPGTNESHPRADAVNKANGTK